MYKYVGKYRVLCEFDQNTLKPCKDDTYITCAKGGQIWRYSDDILVYEREGGRPSAYAKKFKENGVEIIEDSWLDELGQPHVEIKFYEKDVEVVAELVQARTLGANIKPTSKRNLKLFDWYKKAYL